eukprot:CAMPEP_0197192008 /NCGR_PEP_ID=MMETSP1423-20130617/24377_1 /TAXON_ID=476441 /ORGANISM="Pseudo-nitzschia heimii, Strain UNC1101" /LENGTH=1099 /DNA_ID=CAMNT_0042644815 /DNA_START=764 /DNA_END=4063 /DNA_ORIENTATION=+
MNQDPPTASPQSVDLRKGNTQNKSANSRFEGMGRGEGGGAGNFNFMQSHNSHIFHGEDAQIPPFSTFDPVQDLDLYSFNRPSDSSPSERLNPLIDRKARALPTNAWYQNMLRLDIDEEPTKDNRVYTIPYVIDAAGNFPGIRAHASRLEATPTEVRLAIDEPYGLSLGAMSDVQRDFVVDVLDKGYTVHEATDLGLTLHWDSYMKSNLVRGSPYVTMIYDMSDEAVDKGMLPTMHWRLDTSELPIIDGSRTVDCSLESIFTVERDLELEFYNSNQRWMVFFSRPVQLQCQNIPGTPTVFQVSEARQNNENPFLIIRGALVVSSSDTANDDIVFQENYINQLRASAEIYPGQSTSVVHSFNKESNIARLSFDWDVQSMRTNNTNGIDELESRDTNELIMFALPHHRDILAGKVSLTLCTASILGPVCLVEGNVWNMYENLPVVDFQAARHPNPTYVPILAEALVNDIKYQIPSNFQSGAADTYFSGKTIAKLARILLIAEEVKDLCSSTDLDESKREYLAACDGLEIPSDQDMEEALDQLRKSVTVWVKTNAEAPFVYDSSWGGLVSCGCTYSYGECTNVIPDCPSFTDQGLNFGNGFYNDHHFHYGYHVYAAAALAHFDPIWAIDHYDDVALLIRDYANPSKEDTAFPVFRNKDWFRGHSWASGLTKPMFGNIMNQESSSEAIMAYEAVALYGKTMVSIFEDSGYTDKAFVAKMMHDIGLTLTASEIRSAQKYWQVRQDVEESEKIYPDVYTANVVGILWETYSQFTTWFGNAAYLIYGIQLLPLTPISEARDGLDWANEMYGTLAESCDGACISEGWSIQVNAILATIGRVQEAIEGILNVPSTAYEKAGGNGHSKSNSLWYASTRPVVENSSFQNLDEPETISVDEEDEISNADNELPENASPNNEELDLRSDEEDFETSIGKDEESESLSTDQEEFQAIEIDEEYFNTSVKEQLEPEIVDEKDFLVDYEEVDYFFEDFLGGDNTSNDNIDGGQENISDQNNIFDEIIADFEGSYNNGEDDNNINGNSDDEIATVRVNCFNSTDCTDEVLNSDAEGYSCRDRIQYLMGVLNKAEFDACWQVAVEEYPTQCGLCNPSP